jgi:hypothetical protein
LKEFEDDLTIFNSEKNSIETNIKAKEMELKMLESIIEKENQN